MIQKPKIFSSIQYAINKALELSWLEYIFLVLVGFVAWGMLFLTITLVKILSSLLPVVLLVVVLYVIRQTFYKRKDNA